MIETKSYKFYDNRVFAQRWLKLLAAVIVTFALSACEDDTDEPEPAPPASAFKLHIGPGNVEEMDLDAPEYYPFMYNIVLVMEDLPQDEKIKYIGGVYSTDNQQPDISDGSMIYDYTDFDIIQEWDWKENPLYWGCLYLMHPLPETTYYVRGYVQTDKGEYYSNTFEFRSGFSRPVIPNPDVYEIPVIFHLFPDAGGDYPVKEWMVREQIDYANRVYGNYFNIPGQTDTGVRFVAATHAPDGSALKTPGIVYENEAVVVDFETAEIDDKYVWDMEHALNVWVSPIKYGDEVVSGNGTLAGFTFFPVFDADEELEGCLPLSPANTGNGIFLNSLQMPAANTPHVFAHEAGHFLGLDHVFAPEGDFCDDTEWYDYDVYCETTQGDIVVTRTSESGHEFWSDNIMDYDFGFMTGFTSDQTKRIQYTIKHAYFIPGPAGKEFSVARSDGRRIGFSGKPVI